MKKNIAYLDALGIEAEVFYNYMEENGESFYDTIHSKMLKYINNISIRYCLLFKNSYYNKTIKKSLYYNQYYDDKLIHNQELCYELYYKKYADILSKDISKIIDKVFEK